jgi:two-component sensor histidine kinase
MEAHAHPDQARRLATLRRYEILDTPRESDFDDIVELAADICNVPISVINLIDEDRQWFKAEIGIGARETPLATSICSHVILEEDFVEINDTHTDPRTADNELCTPADGLRFYAGALLKASNGMPIGTLCVLDNKPNALTEAQKRALHVLARRVMQELDLRLAIKAQNVLRDEMDHRVKNSLQTIASIVRLHGRRTEKGEAPADAFASIARRIEAVSALHEALHQSDSAQSLRLDEFLERISGYLQESAPPGITITCVAEPLEIRSEIASSIGVIVNEFAANSIKHGYGDDTGGSIRISAGYTDDDGLVLVCEDDGGGKTPAKTGVRNTGLGRRLMSAAAAKVGAQLDSGPVTGGYRSQMTVPSALLSG